MVRVLAIDLPGTSVTEDLWYLLMNTASADYLENLSLLIATLNAGHAMNPDPINQCSPPGLLPQPMRPIIYVLSHGPLELVKLLLEHGARVDLTEANEENAFHHCMGDGVTLAALNVLLKHTPTDMLEDAIDAENSSQKCPLVLALESRRIGKVKSICAAGADVNKTSDHALGPRAPTFYVTRQVDNAPQGRILSNLLGVLLTMIFSDSRMEMTSS